MPEDPDKLILGWMGHISPPNWVERKSCSTCHHCQVKFSRGHQHNCRLCGHMFCSNCTGKYFVQSSFRRKDKSGAARVCFGCRDQCLARRSKFVKNGRVRKHHLSFVMDGHRRRIFPPIWAKEGSYCNCYLCNTQLGSKSHHCRTCGEMFCEDCTTKLNVPDAFRKKGKTGPVRVCNECRYHIVFGAILDEGPAPIDALSNTDPQVQASEDEKKTSSDGLQPLIVRWEGLEKPITTIQVFPSTTLDHIYERLVVAVPTLRSTKFTFVCRNRPIFNDHWSCFNADFLLPEITIKTGGLEIVEEAHPPQIPLSDEANLNETILQQGSRSMPASPKGGGDELYKNLALRTDSAKPREVNFTFSLESNHPQPNPEPLVPNQQLQQQEEHNQRQTLVAGSPNRRRQLYSDVISGIGQARLSTNQIPKEAASVTPSAGAAFTRMLSSPTQWETCKSPTNNVPPVAASESIPAPSPAPNRDVSTQLKTLELDEMKPNSSPTPQHMAKQSKVSWTGQTLQKKPQMFARGQYDFTSEKPNCLTFVQDEILEILKMPENSGWWFVCNVIKEKGWVPAKFLVLIDPKDGSFFETTVDGSDDSVMEKVEQQFRKNES